MSDPDADIYIHIGINNNKRHYARQLVPDADHPRPTTTAVILISKEIVLASALDIDYYPKNDFRFLSRVVLGNNCSGPFFRVRDYTFSPDFTRTTYSSLAIVHLDTIRHEHVMFPICSPPQEFSNGEEIYAMTLFNDCYNSSMVMVHKMDYVDTTHCHDYYRRVELDIETMWPIHLVCAKGVKGGHCIWRSGTALVIRDDGQWKLLGLGVYGPGCQSPSRFLDYGMYHYWVQRSITRIGQPAITRIAPNHLIVRRTTTNIPRFGHCDPEEQRMEIFSDRTTVVPPYTEFGEFDQIANVYYNVTLLHNVDYHCIIIKVWHVFKTTATPVMTIHRFKTKPEENTTRSDIHYFVDIKSRQTCTFEVIAYGAAVHPEEEIELDYTIPT
ncbi:uncharacterized protein LOC110382046 [Helicoverpa armigera]|uniref:uncharacterized protein LOC110382046 n=1 Tax=Helicoverpa armigera TaxID=29058 RepID=UPI0030829894